MLHTIPTWFIPSFYGDIQLRATSETTCDLIPTEITRAERDALLSLEAHGQKEEWIGAEEMVSMSQKTALKAPIDEAAKFLAKALKPGRTIISAVKYKNGEMEEIRSTASPVSEPSKPSKARDTTSTVDRSAKEPDAAVSVATPVRGCPAPDFSQSELRAQRVLVNFLTPEQVADFRTYQKFISVGQTTGNRYMITSRHARDQLAQYQRTLYDLDRQMPICTHDWDVPAAEEMLALHVLLQLPGWETYLNEVTEDNVERVALGHGRIPSLV